jgi:hypothetical protein
MSKTLSLVPVALQPGRSLDIRDGKGTVIAARSGTVWITQAGDKRDIFLMPGETFTVDRNGLTLVGAIGAPAAITLLPVQDHGFDVVTARAAVADMETEPWRRLARYY